MKKVFLLIFICISYLTAHAQPVQQWVSRYNGTENANDWAGPMAVDASGNIYCGGNGNFPGDGSNIFLIKYNSAGVFQWLRSFAGAVNGTDEIHDIKLDASGNIYVSGTIANGNGPNDFCLLKYNPSGTLLWSRHYDGPAHSYDLLHGMIMDNAGNIIICGESWGIGQDYCTIKYNQNGDTLWVRRWDGGENPSAAPNDQAFGLACDNQGNIYVTGNSTRYPAVYMLTTVKYNSAGVYQWEKNLNQPWYETGKQIQADNAGNLYVSGKIHFGNNYDFLVMKMNAATGDTAWVRSYNGPGNMDEETSSLLVDAYGNVYISGSSRNASNTDMTTIKYNSAGVQQWLHTYNGSSNGYDYSYGMKLDTDLNLYVWGQVNSTGTGNDGIIIKYNSEGSPNWIQKFDTNNGNGYCSDIEIIGQNLFMLNGQTFSNVFPDVFLVKYGQPIGADTCFVINNSCSPTGTFSLSDSKTDNAGNTYAVGGCSQSGDTKLALYKYSAGGSLSWVQNYDSSTYDIGFSTSFDNQGNVYVSGSAFGQFLVLKYNSAGVRQWVKFPGIQGAAKEIAVDPSGGIIVCGDNFTTNDIVLLKYDAAGNLLWQRSWNGPANSSDNSRDIAIDLSGNIFIGADTKDTEPLFINDYAVVKYNSAGTFQWAQTYDRYSENLTDITCDNSGNVIASGFSLASSGGNTEALTVKYNSAGVQQWVKFYGSQYAIAYSVTADTAGNIFIAGGIQESSNNGFTLKYNSSGTQQWVKTFSNANYNTYNVGVSVDKRGYIYSLAQSGSGNTVFTILNKYDQSGQPLWTKSNNIGTSLNLLHYVNRLNTDTSGNIYTVLLNKIDTSRNSLTVVKYCQDIVSNVQSEQNYTPTAFKLNQNYPNPFNPATTISFHLPKVSEVKLKVFDITGRFISELVSSRLNEGSHNITFNASHLSSGVYFYRLEAGEFVEVKRMVYIK